MKMKTSTPIRHYLHGDQKEDDPELFFNRFGDLFEPKSHFVDQTNPEGSTRRGRTNRPETHFQRYKRDKSTLHMKFANSPGKFYRPEKAPNCCVVSKTSMKQKAT